MADRRDSFFRQLVTEAFFDSCFDDMEAADWNLAIDMTFIGIVNGVVASQHAAPPDLTVDVTAGVSYDQAGKRCEIPTNVSGFNCAVDENGTSTAVAAPGNERWLSLQLRFDRTLADAQVDGNGNTVYTEQDESYELAIVMGVEQAAGTGLAGPAYTGRPALPADGRLVCDIVLINAQTQILNADINTDRRQDFSIFTAASIPVVSGAWSFLNPATDDVQAVFDFIDDTAIQTDSATEVTQNIIPSVAGRNLGEAAKEWDLYLEEVVPSATSRVDGNWIPKAGGNDLGSGALRWDLFCTILDIAGEIDVDAACRVDGNWIPKAAANHLGAGGLEWDLYVLELVTVAASRVDGDLIPKAGTEALGSAALRWDLFCDVVTSYHASYIGAYLMDGAKDITREMNLSAMEQPLWAANSWQWQQQGAWGGRNITGWGYSSAGATAGDIELDFADGIIVTDLLLTWYQAAGGAALDAEVFTVDYKGVEASKGSFTISGVGAWKDKEAMGLVDFTVDRSTYKYILRVTGVASQDCALSGVGMTATVVDIGKAAI